MKNWDKAVALSGVSDLMRVEEKGLRRGGAWHLITCEYPPRTGGVSDYTRLVAEGLSEAGDEVHVWCPPSVVDESVAVKSDAGNVNDIKEAASSRARGRGVVHRG